jgi:hypothetical protein
MPTTRDGLVTMESLTKRLVMGQFVLSACAIAFLAAMLRSGL